MVAKVEAERDLLFGILALQNGLIEQADLIAAFQCWTTERSRPMGQVLLDRGALSRDDRTMLDGLVRRHMEKRGGEPERGAEDMAALRLRAIRDIDPAAVGPFTIGVGPPLNPEDSSDASFTLGQATSEGGRFRLIRHHARGGIGTVFVALDSELHREVALKQIQHHHADDPTSRARFLLEAEVTGRLEHPGVVPVYGLGTNEQGRPYYAMRFVRGESLKEAIDRFHRADKHPGRDPAERTLALRQLLRRFIDVCNAIAYAHSRGVIHRDLKPANILLGPYGETLVVDWGLAKVVGRDDPTPLSAAERTLRPEWHSGTSETMAGSAIGTPSYMSPEQAEGRTDRIGPASDIYGLGATLYGLVTGQPPLEGIDIDKLLRRVRQGDIPPPRQVNPRVPAALEAIVVKAMAPRPADRYESAHALAEEVERWLADEPVRAHREPAWERARRWMRRRRTAVAAIAAGVLAATIGLAAVLAVQTRANVALHSANLDLELANRQVNAANRELRVANERERARFDLALEAIKTFHGGVSEDLLLREKQFDSLRTRLLRGATDFYRRLEDRLEGEPDRHSRAALGQAYHDIGELTARIGSQAEALAALRRGLEIRLALAFEVGTDPAPRRDAALSLIALGDLQEANGEMADALASFEQARNLLEPLARSEPDEPSYRAAEAKCLRGIARVQYHTGRAAEALTSHQRARAIFQGLADAFPALTPFQSDLAACDHDIGAIQRASGYVAEALASYQRALAIRRKLADADPAAAPLQSDLAQSHNDIGFLLNETGHPAEALASLERARAIFQELADVNPAVTQFQGDLAQTHQVLGSVQDQTGHSAEALASFERAQSILQKLVAANPRHALFQSRLAMSHSYVGMARQQAGRPAEAAAELGRAVAIMERLCDLQPDGYNLYNLACFRSQLSGMAAKPGSGLTAADAGSLGEQAVDALRRAVAAGLRDFAFMRRDPDLDPLRSRPDFQVLMMDLEFPEEPFAR
jgi:eukaryotic-like serine/threonine-protein kinase